MSGHDLVTAAMRFAAEKHEGTFRPDSKRTPFITHLSEVAALVGKAGGSPEEVAAAWLHDLVEDGLAPLSVVEQQFGPAVAALVGAVTDPEDIRTQPIAERKAVQARRLAEAPAGAKRLKLAEQISILRALAAERPLSWTLDRSINYVQGAHRVAAICAGVNPLLDQEFAAAHRAAQATLPIPA